MIRWVVALVAALGLLLAACDDLTPFEHSIAHEINDLRSRYGRPRLPYSHTAGLGATQVAERCDAMNAGLSTPLSHCHSGDHVNGEVIVVWTGSSACDQTAAKVRGTVASWEGSPGHLVYLVDYGWPPAKNVGVASRCDRTRPGGGAAALYIVARLMR